MEEEDELDYGFDEPEDDPTWDIALARINSPSPAPDELDDLGELNFDELECVDEDSDDERVLRKDRDERENGTAEEKRHSSERRYRDVQRCSSERNSEESKDDKRESFSLLKQRKSALKDLENRERRAGMTTLTFSNSISGRDRRRARRRPAERRVLDPKELARRKEVLIKKRMNAARKERERRGGSPSRRSPVPVKVYDKREYTITKDDKRMERSRERLGIREHSSRKESRDYKESQDYQKRRNSREKEARDFKGSRNIKDSVRVYKSGILVAGEANNKIFERPREKVHDSQSTSQDSRKISRENAHDPQKQDLHIRDERVRRNRQEREERVEHFSETARSETHRPRNIAFHEKRSLRENGKFGRMDESESSDWSDSDSDTTATRESQRQASGSPHVDPLTNIAERVPPHTRKGSTDFVTSLATANDVVHPDQRSRPHGHHRKYEEKGKERGKGGIVREGRVHRSMHERDYELQHIAERVRIEKRAHSEMPRQGEDAPDVISIEGPLANGWCSEEPELDATPRSESALLKSPSPFEEESICSSARPIAISYTSHRLAVATEVPSPCTRHPVKHHSPKREQFSRDGYSKEKRPPHQTPSTEKTSPRHYNLEKHHSPPRDEKHPCSSVKHHLEKPRIIIPHRSKFIEECRNPTLEIASPTKNQDSINSKEEIKIALAAITAIRKGPSTPRQPDTSVPSLPSVSPGTSRTHISHLEAIGSVNKEVPRKKTRIPISAPSPSPAKQPLDITNKTIKLRREDESRTLKLFSIRPSKMEAETERPKDTFIHKRSVTSHSEKSEAKKPKMDHECTQERKPITAPRSKPSVYQYKPRDWHSEAISSVIPTSGPRIPIKIEGLDVPTFIEKSKIAEKTKAHEKIQLRTVADISQITTHVLNEPKQSGSEAIERKSVPPKLLEAEDLQITTKTLPAFSNTLFAKAMQATTANAGTPVSRGETLKEKKWNPKIKLRRKLSNEEDSQHQEMHNRKHLVSEVMLSTDSQKSPAREVVLSPNFRNNQQREVVVEDIPIRSRNKHHRKADFICTINNEQIRSNDSPLKVHTDHITPGATERLIVFEDPDSNSRNRRCKMSKKKDKVDTLIVR